MIDGSIVRVHQHGAEKNEQANEAEGKSGGGLSTKILSAVDALGNPVCFIMTPTDWIGPIRANVSVAVILACKHRHEGRYYDKVIVKQRNLVERLF